MARSPSLGGELGRGACIAMDVNAACGGMAGPNTADRLCTAGACMDRDMGIVWGGMGASDGAMGA